MFSCCKTKQEKFVPSTTCIDFLQFPILKSLVANPVAATCTSVGPPESSSCCYRASNSGSPTDVPVAGHWSCSTDFLELQLCCTVGGLCVECKNTSEEYARPCALFYTVIVFNPPANAEYSDNFWKINCLGHFYGAMVFKILIFSSPSDLSEAVDVYSDWIDACEAANS